MKLQDHLHSKYFLKKYYNNINSSTKNADAEEKLMKTT